jgi:hypothetical protein
MIRATKEADNRLNTARLYHLFDRPIANYYFRSKDNPQESDWVTEMAIIHQENFQYYARRRMKFALKNKPTSLKVFKIARLMKNAGITAKVPKNCTITHLESNYPLFLRY